MGDRYTISAPAEKLASRFGRDISERYNPRFNAAPTQVLPVITQGSKGISYFFWGQLPERSKNKPVGSKLLYVSSDVLRSTSSGSSLLGSHRCIIPADSFYAWKQVSKKGRIPHRILQEDESIFAMAGIWEEFEDDDGHVVHTFRIIMHPSEGEIAGLCPKIPFILEANDEEKWLDSATALEELHEILDQPSQKRLRHYTVSPRIDDPANDNASLIKPFSPADQFGNYSLFD